MDTIYKKHSSAKLWIATAILIFSWLTTSDFAQKTVRDLGMYTMIPIWQSVQLAHIRYTMDESMDTIHYEAGR